MPSRSKPRRRKPASHLRYWSGPVERDRGFRTVLIYCMGPAELPNGYHSRCHHAGRLRLAELPEWDWYDISAHLKCTRCGSVGWVDTRLDWSEVIDFNKGIGSRCEPTPSLCRSTQAGTGGHHGCDGS